MKRIRWNGSEYEWDDGGPKDVLRSDVSGMLDSDYRGSDWREIESVRWVPETGDFFITVKEPPKVPTLIEAAENWKRLCMTKEEIESYRNASSPLLNANADLCDAIDRELANPTKPGKYTDDAVEEYLAIRKQRCSSDFSETCGYTIPDHVREWKAVNTLLKQRDANAT